MGGEIMKYPVGTQFVVTVGILITADSEQDAMEKVRDSLASNVKNGEITLADISHADPL